MTHNDPQWREQAMVKARRYAESRWPGAGVKPLLSEDGETIEFRYILIHPVETVETATVLEGVFP